MTNVQVVRRRRYRPYVVSWPTTPRRAGGERRFATLNKALAYARGPRVSARQPRVDHVDRAGWSDAYDIVTGEKVPT